MKDPLKIAATACVALVLTAGCGGKGGSEQAKDQAQEPGRTMLPSTPSGGSAAPTFTLAGKVRLEGKAPARAPIKMAADLVCAEAHQEPMLTEDVIVDGDNMLQNVFVYVKAGLEGREFPIPSDPVVLDQQGCRYAPHVFGVMVGQPVKYVNSDPTLHSVHALPSKGEFSRPMAKQGIEFTKTFEVAEVPVHIRCDVHPWMSAWCGVVSHPFHAVSDVHGRFTIRGLPAGTYTFEAWHEKFGTQSQQVTVSAAAPPEVSFTFKAAGP